MAHTDESFDNPDLGNCLDYTDNMDANKHPDQGLYETLLALYGPISNGRLLRGRKFHETQFALALTPDHVQERKSQVVRELLERRDDNSHAGGWSLLHRSRHGEIHEFDLEEGYRVRVQMLLA